MTAAARTQMQRARELLRRLRRERCPLEILREMLASFDALASEVIASSDGTMDEYDHAVLVKTANDLRDLVRALEAAT